MRSGSSVVRISKRAIVPASRDGNLTGVGQVNDSHGSRTRAPRALARMRPDCNFDIVPEARGKVHQAFDGEDLNAAISESRYPRRVDAEPDGKQTRGHSRRHVEHCLGQFEPDLFLVGHDAKLGHFARILIIPATQGAAFECIACQ
jgi:hypothetical protein